MPIALRCNTNIDGRFEYLLKNQAKYFVIRIIYCERSTGRCRSEIKKLFPYLLRMKDAALLISGDNNTSSHLPNHQAL